MRSRWNITKIGVWNTVMGTWLWSRRTSNGTREDYEQNRGKQLSSPKGFEQVWRSKFLVQVHMARDSSNRFIGDKWPRVNRWAYEGRGRMKWKHDDVVKHVRLGWRRVPEFAFKSNHTYRYPKKCSNNNHFRVTSDFIMPLKIETRLD